MSPDISCELSVKQLFHMTCQDLFCMSRLIFKDKIKKKIKKKLRVSSAAVVITLRKHAYSNILKISPPKTESFQIKILMFFLFLLKNIDCGYPQSMFLSRNKKNNVYPWKPKFYYIKVGFKGVKII